jgi:TonB-dependent receptor
LPDDIRFGKLSNTDILPSLNLVYQLNDKMNIRAAASRTLARPTFRELAPFQSFDFVGGYIFVGNPKLERTLITNTDLRWEWFVRPGEIIALSTFYKVFDNPIEREIQRRGEGSFISVRNVPEAIVYGLELEMRKQLNQITDAPVLRNMQFGGNFSLVYSTVDIPDQEYQEILIADPDADRSRPLEGQSPYIVNLDATYENLDSGTVASLYYNLFGERLVTVVNGAAPDVFEQPRSDLDFTLSQRVIPRLSLKASVKNILNSYVKQVQSFKEVDYPYLVYPRARRFSLGVSYSI